MKNLWLLDPEEHDYPAAFDYLELLFPSKKASELVSELKKSNTMLKKAKDILRASELDLLDKDNKHVKENIKKSKHGKKLSPILLVRGSQKLIIADGYHRLCAIYYLSEDLDVPCRLI
jgi:disulfide oxidoreductase YuzD